MQGSDSWHCLWNIHMKEQRTNWIKASLGDSLKRKLALSLIFFNFQNILATGFGMCPREVLERPTAMDACSQWMYQALTNIWPCMNHNLLHHRNTSYQRSTVRQTLRAMYQVQLSSTQLSCTKLRWSTWSIIYLPDLSLHLYQLKQLENKINVLRNF